MLHENWRAWGLFHQCATQWRREIVMTSNMRKPAVLTHGLNYPAVESVFRLNGVKRKHQKTLFQKIRLIEIGALDGFSQRQD